MPVEASAVARTPVLWWLLLSTTGLFWRRSIWKIRQIAQASVLLPSTSITSDMRKLCHAICYVKIPMCAGATNGNGSPNDRDIGLHAAKLRPRELAAQPRSCKLNFGSCTLTATQYRDKNFTGAQPASPRINFSITSNAHTRRIATPPSNAQLVANVYPTLVPGHATVGLSGSPNGWAYIEFVELFGNFFPGNTEKFIKGRMSLLQRNGRYLNTGRYLPALRRIVQTCINGSS